MAALSSVRVNVVRQAAIRPVRAARGAPAALPTVAALPSRRDALLALTAGAALVLSSPAMAISGGPTQATPGACASSWI